MLGEIKTPRLGVVACEIVESAEEGEEKHGLQHEIERANPAGGAEAVGRTHRIRGQPGKRKKRFCEGSGAGRSCTLIRWSEAANSAVQKFYLDAEDAEDERQDGTADVEKELAGINDAAGEVLVVGKNLGVFDRGF